MRNVVRPRKDTTNLRFIVHPNIDLRFLSFRGRARVWCVILHFNNFVRVCRAASNWLKDKNRIKYNGWEYVCGKIDATVSDIDLYIQIYWRDKMLSTYKIWLLSQRPLEEPIIFRMRCVAGDVARLIQRNNIGLCLLSLLEYYKTHINTKGAKKLAHWNEISKYILREVNRQYNIMLMDPPESTA